MPEPSGNGQINHHIAINNSTCSRLMINKDSATKDSQTKFGSSKRKPSLAKAPITLHRLRELLPQIKQLLALQVIAKACQRCIERVIKAKSDTVLQKSMLGALADWEQTTSDKFIQIDSVMDELNRIGEERSPNVKPIVKKKSK